MKVKEIGISANLSWSPDYMQTPYLVCGTSSQQIDTSFSSSSILQIYDLNKKNVSLDMKLVASKNVPAKFNTIVWNEKQSDASALNSGVIAGGCDNGAIYIYSADKLLRQEEQALVASMEGKHSGPVFSLDFNHHQANLLATGSRDCEIIIWDINDTTTPMTPGAKPNLNADVTAVAWNRKVEHIMASTYSGRCVVYDLRKSASIVQIAESVSRIKASIVRWHPNVATQLVLCSDDDNTPFGQVWDLRFAASPLKSLEGHQRGIVATMWCLADPDLLITSGKDNKMFIWNPNNNEKFGEIVGEFPSYNQWSFDMAWCHKDPSLVATSSVDGTVSVYSLLGAGIPPAQNNKFSAIADSFPGMEMPAEVPQTVQPQPIYLKRPPQWLPRRCGASFGFGGRLLSWNGVDPSVSISQVITEPELVSRSSLLEEALSRPDLRAFCQSKAETSSDAFEQTLWNFIEATFESSARKNYMSLLGFTPEQVAAKVRPEDLTVSPEELAEKIANLGYNGQDGSTSSLDPSEQFEMIASAQSLDKTPDADTEGEPNFESASTTEPICLSIGEDSQGMIRHALLVGDYESAVHLCLKEKKHSLALILAAHAGIELFNKTRDRVLRMEPQNGLASLTTCVVQRDLFSLVSKCGLSDWKESLVAILTYSSNDELGPLLESLGERLELEGGRENCQSALLCFLCSGNLDKFVTCFAKTNPSYSSGTPSSLQNLVEIMVILERALSTLGQSVSLKDGSVASSFLCKYAALLASQGALSTAVSYLNNPTEGVMMDLRDRLYRALGYPTGSSLASRNRTISASSQPAYRRASTPLAYQHAFPLCASVASVARLVPPQFTPSVQAQQASYGSSSATPFFSPQPISKQPPSFMQPTAIVPPSFGGATTTTTSSQFQLFQPSPTTKPSGSSSSTGPLSFGSTPGGFRRPNAPNRYLTESPATPTPGVAATPFSSGGVFTPSPNTPRQVVQPNATFSPFNPTTVTPVPPPPLPGNFPPPPPPSSMGGNVASPLLPEASEALGNPMTPAAFDPAVPRGWNDPPPLSSARRWDGNPSSGPSYMGEHSGSKRLHNLKTKQKQKNSSTEPSVAPVQGLMVPEPVVPQQQCQGFPQQTFPGPMPSLGVPGQTAAAAAATIQPTQPQLSQHAVPKGPLPAEHQIIQEVLNRLREKAVTTTGNPAARQRLEDLSPKFEILYDKLREGKIGANTTTGLHQIVSAVRSGDYHRALQLHGSTISSGAFSEMSQFMPAIKMLLTTCMQCQVFYH